MLKKLIRISGLISIIGIAISSVTIFQFEKDILSSNHPYLARVLAYLSFFEDRFYDMRMKLTLDPNAEDPRIVLAAIDEKSLNHIGRWPWSRMVWKPILEKMQKFGVKIIAFDSIFSEPEKICGDSDPDTIMAGAIGDFIKSGDNNSHKVIVPYSLMPGDAPEESFFKEIPPELYDYVLNSKGEAVIGEQKVCSTTFPIKSLLDQGVGLGFIGADEDLDGLFRHYPLLVNVDTTYFPSLALLAYQHATGDKPELESVGGKSYLNFHNGKLQLNMKGEVKVRWFGGINTYATIGLYDIMNADENDEKIKKLLDGKIVLIGSTAFAAHDLRHTPIDPKMPGVLFHMNVISMLLDGKYYKDSDISLYWSWGILAIGTLLMICISLVGNAILDVGFMLAFCIGMFYFDVYYLLPNGYQITLFFALFAVFGTYFWNTLINFYLANKDKKFLKNAFGSYISPELIDEMHRSGKPPKLGGAVGVLTAYFTDIQSFSTFSEKLSAPRLVELLNEYLTVMTDILLEHKGTLDKYEGDAIVSFFGAPLPLPDHAIQACQVALKMQAALGDLRKKWTAEGDKWPEIVHKMRMRIGINSGEIVTGNMGSRSRMNYTMMGDSVNLAARLEAAAKQYGIFIQLSHFTKALTEDRFIMRELDTIKVVGKSEPVTTFDLLGEKGNTSEDLLKLQEFFQQGLTHYKQQEWDSAIKNFEAALEYEHKRYPELKGKTNPSLIYIERCKEFKTNPPPANWDGVYALTEK
ncbi:MAG: adenylate/guanylate cyclase domain-containing protein [Oligoflexia bacterium]|nr:adenylate/guanylate cyclase domain-containing protein [Oligoflexia bacterium]MBF0364869.1 adenylate/guanylate cyclase domain-containing protein [Oligoflexia bacterium]